MSVRRRWAAAAGILAACFVYSLLAEPRGAGPRPLSALRLSPDRLDFGEVRVGETRSAAVALENAGPVPLTVAEIDVPCGCLRVKLPNRTIPPGGKEQATVEFLGTVGRLPGEYRVAFATGEPARPRVAMLVRGVARREYRAEPETLAFGAIAAPRTLELTLRRADGAPFELRAIRGPAGDFDCAWRPDPAGGYRIAVTAHARRAGFRSETLSIFIGDAAFPQAEFHAIAEVRAP